MELPHLISEKNREMARQYNEYAKEFALLKKNRAVEWLEIKRDNKCTNKEADMYLDATGNGQRYLFIKELMKGLEKQMSAEKAHLRVLDVFGN